MANGSFTHQHRVTYASCTVGNHVYYSRYLDILEEARGEFFRDLGTSLISLHDDGIEFPVRDCQIRYENSARYDDVLTIELVINHVDRLWLKFGFSIRDQNNDVVVEGQTDHVCTGDESKPKRMPKSLFGKLKSFAGNSV